MGGASGINVVRKYFSGFNAPHVCKRIPPLARIRRTDLKANTMNIPLRKRGRQTMGYSGDSNSVTGFSPNSSSIQRTLLSGTVERKFLTENGERSVCSRLLGILISGYLQLPPALE